MTDVQLAFTQLAFRELRQFSIPGIGTFVKKLAGAQVDMAQNVIYPPAERFVFTPGGATYTQQFVSLLERKQHMAPEQAAETVALLGQALLKQLKTKKTVEIPGIGKLSLAVDDTLAFVLTNEDPTLQTYGLVPIAYGGRTEEVLEKDLPKQKKKDKDKGKPKSKPKDKAKAKPARKPDTGDAQAERPTKGKKRTRLLAVVILLLVAGLTAGVIYAWPQIKAELFKNEAKADDVVEAKKPAGKPGKKAEPAQKDTMQTPPADVQDAPAPKDPPKPAPKPTPKPQPKPAETTTQADPGNVTYRLVLAQTYSQAQVEEEKGFWVEYGGVVVPAGGGRYTIQFFSSKNRAAVAGKQQALIASGVFYHASQTKILP